MFYYFIILFLGTSYYLYKLNLKLLSINILLDKIHKQIHYQYIYYRSDLNNNSDEIYNIESTSDSIISNNYPPNDKIYIIL